MGLDQARPNYFGPSSPAAGYPNWLLDKTVFFSCLVTLLRIYSPTSVAQWCKPLFYTKVHVCSFAWQQECVHSLDWLITNTNGQVWHNQKSTDHFLATDFAHHNYGFCCLDFMPSKGRYSWTWSLKAELFRSNSYTTDVSLSLAHALWAKVIGFVVIIGAPLHLYEPYIPFFDHFTATFTTSWCMLTVSILLLIQVVH